MRTPTEVLVQEGSRDSNKDHEKDQMKNAKTTNLRVVQLLIAGVGAICLNTLFPVHLIAQGTNSPAKDVSSADPSAKSTAPKKRYTAASVRALPRLECKVYPTGGARSASVTVFTDDDGYARFHAVRPASASEVQQLTMDCKDSDGQTSSYAVDLTSDDTFAPRKLDMAGERGTDRPALQGDPLNYSQAELLQAGYGLRPDPQKDAAAYDRWLATAVKPGRMLGIKRLNANSHGVTTITAPAWVGSVLTGSPTYDLSEATFNVPTAIPGGDGTTVTEIAIWNGLGGFGTGSGLIQGGVNVSTTPTVASYGTWREYCCGDPNSNGYGGAFVPSPGDKIYSQEWYCDANGNLNLNGGYGCTFLYDFASNAVLSCTSANGSPCWSVPALPLCSASPNTPNCMTLGQAAEFVIENQSPQVSTTSTAFTDFTPQVTMSGAAHSSTTNSYLTINNDPSIYLLTDFTKTSTSISVTLGTIDETYFNVSPSAGSWNQFEMASTCPAASSRGLKGISRIPTSMEVWWICADGSIWDAYWYEGQAGWNQYQLSGPGSAAVTSEITAVSRQSNTMELWWVRPDGGVQDAYWYDGQAGWNQYELSGPGSASVTGSMTAVSRQPNTMELWWVRPDGGVQDAYWYDGQAGWNQYQLSGQGSASLTGAMTAVSRQSNTMELWWVSPDGGVQDAYWYDGQAGWNQYQLSGQGSASVTGAMTAVSRQSNTMELWWVSPDGGVQDAYWYDGQVGWNQYQLSGQGSASVNGSMTAVSRQPNTMELWWVRPDGGVQDAYWYDGQTGWNQYQLSGPGSASANGAMTAVSRQSNTMELWWGRPDGGVQDAYWYQ